MADNLRLFDAVEAGGHLQLVTPAGHDHGQAIVILAGDLGPWTHFRNRQQAVIALRWWAVRPVGERV